MYKGLRTLAVIPARGGSKGIPGKNIRPLAGRPLLAYTIEQALVVPELDVTVVSTDDGEIADVALRFGGRVVERPAELAGDEAPTEWALIHALDHLEQISEEVFDLVVVLEPTSPFRRPETISRCIRELADSMANSLLTLEETYKNIGTRENGVFRPVIPGQPRRRQDRRPLFVESSTVYVCRVPHLRDTGWLVSDDWLSVVVGGNEAVDINELADFVLAESLMKDQGSYK